MMQSEASAAEVHEQGLPPDDFVRRWFRLTAEGASGSISLPPEDPAFVIKALEKLQALLLEGRVVASGVACGPCPLSADPRCTIHLAHWHRMWLRRAIPGPRSPMISDEVKLPTGEQVVALRLRWASSAIPEPAASSGEGPSPAEKSALRRGEFDRWLRQQMEASPSFRTLVKGEIELEAERRGVVAQHALKLRRRIIDSDPARFAAWGGRGSKKSEDDRGRAARAELKKLRAKKAALKQRP